MLMQTSDVFWDDSVPNPYGKFYGPGPGLTIPFFLSLLATISLSAAASTLPLAGEGRAGAFIVGAIVFSALSLALGIAFVRSVKASNAQGAEDMRLFMAEGDRVDAACREFLSERGVEMSADEMDEFIPVDAPSEEGLVSISQGVLGGNVVNLALYYHEGELVLTGTDGQELRPLVAA